MIADIFIFLFAFAKDPLRAAYRFMRKDAFPKPLIIVGMMLVSFLYGPFIAALFWVLSRSVIDMGFTNALVFGSILGAVLAAICAYIFLIRQVQLLKDIDTDSPS